MTTRIQTHSWLVVLLIATAFPSVSMAQTADTLRGRVSSDSGVAIVGAQVVATRAPDRAFKSTTTDSAGNYLIIFEQGTGDYLLHVAAIGRETARVRVKRAGTETTLSHDFQLKSAVQKLETVTVEARPDKPERDRGFPEPRPGESGRAVDGVTSAIPPDVRSSIAAAAATVPGVAVTPNGISVLGLDPSQNRTTLNGLSFSGGDIPRNARTYTHVATSAYDPSQGWFSGAQVDVFLDEGSIYTAMPVSLTLDAPALQYTDRTSSGLGQRFSNVLAGLGRSGGFRNDKMDYNMAVDLSHRASDFASLERAGPDLLERSGVARDSVTRLLGILSAEGIPFSSGSQSDNRTSDNMTFIGRIDHSRYNITSSNDEKVTWGLVGYTKLARSSQLGVGPTAVAMHGGDESQQIFSGQALYSSYLHHNQYLTEAQSSFNLKHDRTTPYLRLPDGRVLVSSQFPDGLDATTSLAFGGNGALAQDSRNWTWETNSVTRFYVSKRARHRVQLNADSRIDGFSQSTGGNTNGTFGFNSLADLAANTPSSFTRTLSAPTSSAKEWNAFASLGDYWRKSANFQLLAGARLEANRFLDSPRYNPDVERIFGVRNDQAPAGVHASPRIGFTWVRKPAGNGIRFSPIGIFNSGSIAYLRGGFGEFRNLLPPSVLSQAMVANGLPGGASYLTCIGASTPTPDWSGYALDPTTIPGQCVGGTGAPNPFADAAPSVALFDKSYQPPRSWRGNLSYASSLGKLIYSLEGIYSLNLNQPSRSDLNFTNLERFTTSLERRPVFVGASSIVPTTGLVSTVDARESTLFGPVISNRSDARSISRQLTFNLSPDFDFASSWYVSLAYTLSSVRSLASGFNAPTFASPLDREWARGDFDARHRIQLQAGKTIKRLTFTLFGTFQSGLPFTPLVGGDVNGDGFFNDRAFIFDPARPPDSAVGEGLHALATTSSARIRDCVTSQLGRAARRNSCEGPWTTALNANLSTQFEIPKSLHRYVSISLAISNPLGGLDQLLHGSSHLRGWGLQAFPDPVLYNVRGFDSTTRSFRYEVNPRFGNTQPATSIIRSPFRLTLDISTNIGPAFPMQQLQRLVSAGRGGHPGTRLDAATIKKRYSHSVPDPYAAILEEGDSLLLTAEQEKALETAQTDYLRGMDSVWTPLAEHLAGLGDTFDAKEAVQRQEETADAAWEYTRLHVQKTLGAILSPIQLKLLPWPAGFLYAAKQAKGIRMFVR
ncbi:MAG: carboxypeptidase-like regulatory domain-containing protein [Gemmatimonadaceae bacterium]